MVLVNRPNQYIPLAHAEGGPVIDDVRDTRQSTEVNSLFYPVDSEGQPPEITTLQRASEILADPASAGLQLYQLWCESGWKAVHGTTAAANRFGEKSTEEWIELQDAIQELRGATEENLAQRREHLLEELGDNLFCVVANSSNSSADIDSGSKNLLFRYVHGINHLTDGVWGPPAWRENAGQLAIKHGDITVEDIDQLIEAGFEPTLSPVMNIYEPEEDEEGTTGHMLNLSGDLAEIRNLSLQQYGSLDEFDDTERPKMQIEAGAYYELARGIGEYGARSVIRVAFLADRLLNKKLSDVVAYNVAKITERILTNTVDKSDGPRA